MSGYLELILVSVIFSFGGTLIKLGKEMCGPETISFLRFFLVAIVSVFLYKEKYTKRTFLATVFCILGVLLISWKGLSLSDLAGENLWITGIFMLGAVGNAGFTIVQKQLLSVADTYERMLSMFILGAVVLIFPAAASGTWYLGFHWPALFGIVALGVITGVTFLMISDSLRTVPLHLVPLIQSITVVLAVVWGILFWGEPVTTSVIIGTILSLLGVVMLKSK